MKLVWLGQSGFRLETGNQVLLIDPWLRDSPVFDDARREEAIRGAAHVLVSHGHGDHATDAREIAKELDIPAVGMFELMNWWEGTDGIQTVGFNKGGTVALGDIRVTMVNASHSSSTNGPDGPVYTGAEAGYMIEAEGHTIYFSGDTDIMADMEWMGELHKPDIGILCAGGHYTMDMKRAAWAAKRYFDFKTVIPCHYRTFPLLEQSAQAMKDALPGVRVVEPELMQPIEI